MKVRYVESSIRISTTTTDRERISRWGRTRLSRDQFSRRKWGQSWQCRRSADCTTVTNDRPANLPDSEITKIASKGGKARAKKLTAAERSRIAKLGVAARERKRKGKS